MSEIREKIYIADDDPNIREGIRIFLESEGYRTLEIQWLSIIRTNTEPRGQPVWGNKKSRHHFTIM